ncbi:AcrR family transcriptional regulator [Catenuloplanes nepalensis]|uniref:AcrR family transcriptional regulator n=1 Tax=Catenuloplanes nepalensis TaxID=587533 RepID=A0ABT9MKQ1_9ACTN|nr:TetR/AcrR family transcriptional regulator [Catenuloplanes nepalensis]MDP9792009.1 AcrR family transcriptional regulator [Catenuloplanes nepalensis]
MPRAGLDRATVVSAGAALADEVGLAKLTMGLLAERLGVRTPSLYKHVENLESLHRGISLLGKREFGQVLARATAGRSGADAGRAFADAWRRWALEHPGRYAAGDHLPAPGDEEELRATNEILQLLYDVLAGFDLPGARVVDAARALRSVLHGFTALEAAGGFGLPTDIDRSFRFLIDTVITGLQAPPSGLPPDDDHPGRQFHPVSD